MDYSNVIKKQHLHMLKS